jgi:regulatory protein
MKITKITQQLKQAGRYSIFVDEKYSFSLSDTALLESHLAAGDELTEAQVAEFKKLSADDKVYAMTLRYIAMRPRTEWEIKTYLERKKSPAPLIEQITNKLHSFDLLDDAKFARSYVHDRQLLRPTSRRKMILELKTKRVPEEVIQQVLVEEEPDEQAALRGIIESKRRQTRYKDDLKLMQYLARQGFNYGDIKSALQAETED